MNGKSKNDGNLFAKCETNANYCKRCYRGNHNLRDFQKKKKNLLCKWRFSFSNAFFYNVFLQFFLHRWILLFFPPLLFIFINDFLFYFILLYFFLSSVMPYKLLAMDLRVFNKWPKAFKSKEKRCFRESKAWMNQHFMKDAQQ